MDKAYPFVTGQVLTDDIFANYGGLTGTTTTFQRGAALMTRRQIFSAAGMFWEGYGKGTWEDVDFSMAVKEMGKRVVAVPEAVGTHYTGATATQQNTGFPMGENYQKFLLRWRAKLKQTDIDVL